VLEPTSSSASNSWRFIFLEMHSGRVVCEMLAIDFNAEPRDPRQDASRQGW
jgi:hypothetical protein